MKDNQKLLLQQINENTAEDRQSIYIYSEQTGKRGRIEVRKPFIYKNLSGIPEQWTGLNRFIRVERYVSHKNRQRHETACYISDISSSKAALFARHIRNHWGIENLLHRVKDVIMKEDESGIKTGMAAENISVIRISFAIFFEATVSIQLNMLLSYTLIISKNFLT